MIASRFSFASMITKLISMFVFLFSALALVVPSGYSYGPLLLFIPALFFLFVRPYPALTQEDKYVILALLAYSFAGLLINFFHHLPGRSYDSFSRFLFAVPVLLLLLRFRINPNYFWAGLAVGAIGAGILALDDIGIRASRYNNAIQFGDISMLFSCLLIAGITHAKKISTWFFMLFIVGIVAGTVASILSLTRGGWLALPVAFSVFVFATGFYRNAKNIILFLAVVSAVMIVIYPLKQTEIFKGRVDQTIDEIQRYNSDRDVSSSIGKRIVLWQLSVDMIAERPLLGWGSISNYVQATENAPDILQQFNHVHNDFLDALVKRGVIGGLALLGIFAVPFILFYRKLKSVSVEAFRFAVAGMILVSSTFVFGLTQAFFCHNSGAMVYVFMLVIIWTQVRQAELTDS